jgi:hypothetical protein
MLRLIYFILFGALLPVLIGAFIALDLFWGFRDAFSRAMLIYLLIGGGVVGAWLYYMPRGLWRKSIKSKEPKDITP